MEPDLPEVDEVTQAMDYLADQIYTSDQLQTLKNCLLPVDPNLDLDSVKNAFVGKRGVISRLRTLVRFVGKYQSNPELIVEFQNEIEYLIAGLEGREGTSFSL